MNIKKDKEPRKDIVTKDASGKEKFWIYSDVVQEHFFNPKNFLLDDGNYNYDGKGSVGSPACGDMMIVWIKVDPKTKKIKECKWRTFGCASAIASTSMMSVMVTEKGGMEIKKALKLKAQDIVKRLSGLPVKKIHCSVLGQTALKKAIENYLAKTNH